MCLSISFKAGIQKRRGTKLYLDLRLWKMPVLDNKVKPTSCDAGVITLYPCLMFIEFSRF